MNEKVPPLLGGWRTWVVGFLFWTVVGLFNFAYQYLDVVVRGRTEPFYTTLIEELTGGYATGLLTVGIVLIARTIVAGDILWVRGVLVHICVAPVYSAIHTTLLWSSRVFVWQALGLGSYDYGRMPVRYFMEAGRDLLDYFVLASLVHLILYYRASQQHALQMAQLEQELTKARLQVLEGQLRPHFLFNALNTVSSIMYRDVAAADRVLTQLGGLLRSSLSSDDTHQVRLADEITTLNLYIGVMRVRFADRLTVDVRVDPAIEDALVPHLLLQPLVENALEHGDPGDDEHRHIEVTARLHGQSVELSVADNGNGAPGGIVDYGVGLGNTVARLKHLYPDTHTFSIGNGESGLQVKIVLPFQA